MLREKIAGLEASGHKVITEPALCAASGKAVCAPDGLRLPLRYDLVIQRQDGEFQKENADSTTIEFGEPLFATWDEGLRIEIHRLCWDYMCFELFPVLATIEWDGLRRWFLKWFDADDKDTAGKDGLFGVLHFVSDPATENGVSKFFVDFGSASSDCLAELFDEFVRIGVKQCVIGRKDLPNQPSPIPTPADVTPAARAPVAPPPGAADR